MENRLTTFGHNFQIKSISSLMTNSNFLAQIYDILDESHYDNESLKWVIKQCKSYYNEYKKPITFDVFKVRTNEIGNDSVYWVSGWTDTEPIDIIPQGKGSYAIVIDNAGFESITPTLNDYYFFAKENSVNQATMKGYYGEVEFKNNSTEKAELFSIACDIIESSK